MIENRETEWQNLQAKATQMLENPRILPNDLQIKQFNQTLHLWISPTFTPEKHWIFYTPQPQINPQPNPMVQQIIWHREKDFQRLMNSEIYWQDEFQTRPTFEIKTIEIESEFYQKICSELSKIKLSPFIEVESDGRDGEIFGVETLDLFYSGRIIWWSSSAVEWQELIDWYEEVRKFLEEKFK
ncbi:MAG TPA: hypothetical protein PKE69_07525 [Pyrinomonadaceae bacterium]|nr:hypothetical protein [Pyrinomonadaceae bacterium]